MEREDPIADTGVPPPEASLQPLWHAPTLEILPISLTKNNHPNTPTDTAFAPNFS